MRALVLSAACSALMLCGCSTDSSSLPPLKQKAQANFDLASVPWGVGGPNVTAGTRPVKSVQVTNGGVADLHITNVQVTNDNGDSAFSLSPAPTVPATVKSRQTLVIQMQCDAVAMKAYTGHLIVDSDAENIPHADLVLSCTGV